MILCDTVVQFLAEILCFGFFRLRNISFPQYYVVVIRIHNAQKIWPMFVYLIEIQLLDAMFRMHTLIAPPRNTFAVV